MLDPAIEMFLAERKTAWLKDKLKSCKTEAQQQDVENNANEKFSLANWLPDAAKRAGQLSMVSHTGKFTHPSAKTSAIIAESPPKPDGFLRTGNACTDLDVFGNAAALDVYKFLSLTLTDGQTVLTHLEQDSGTIKAQFALSAVPFVELQEGLLAIKQFSDIAKTSEKIKQVYFPVDDDYHVLSILTPSGLLFKLKQRINDMRFSEATKQAREDRRHQQHNQQGFDDLYDLTVIGFGGTKPQNISVLNNQNGGTAYLLSSMPPPLKPRDLQIPKTNFFNNSLYYKNYQDSFKSLHKLLEIEHNNLNIREGRDKWLVSIIEQALNEQVTEKLWQLRQLDAGWSEKTNLPIAQKIWLDNTHAEQRETEDGWLNEVIADFACWMVFAYQKTVGKEQVIPLGDAELRHIKQLIADHQEDLR